MTMKANHAVVLKSWNSRKQTAETISQVGEPRLLTEALDLSERMNKREGFTFGGFGQYYATERVDLAEQTERLDCALARLGRLL